MRQRGIAGVVLGACVLGPWAAPLALGQVREGAGVVHAQRTDGARELSPRDAMGLFDTVAGWVRAGAVSDGGDARVHAAAVTLRVDGAVVGRGAATSELESDGPPVRTAARGAIIEASGRLERGTDALQAEAAAEFWSRATLSLELAGALVPLDVKTFDDVDADVRPGVEGVAARVGARLELVFPATMLARNVGPGDALASAIALATGEPGVALREDPAGQPARLAQTRGLRCYRFRTVHIAQTAAGRPGIFLERGGRFVPQESLTTGAIAAWAASLTRNLIARRHVVDGQVLHGGVYQPVLGRFEGDGASAFEEVLIARALWRSAVTLDGRGHVDAARDARRAAGEMIDAIARRTPGKGAPADEASAAALWACLMPQVAGARTGSDASDAGTWPPEWRDSYRAALAVLGRAVGGGVPAETRPVIAFALARRAGEKWDGVGEGVASRALARGEMNAVFASVSPGQLVTHMPWLGWAELYIPGEPLAAAPALREMRDAVYAHQLRAGEVAPENVDLAGGIVFTGARSPLPTWHTARVAAFLASAISDARLTNPAEKGREIYRLTSMLRFLRQLTADDATGFMFADPERAAGGVRAALWDQRQPPEATALTLFAACETLRAVREGGGEGP